MLEFSEDAGTGRTRCLLPHHITNLDGLDGMPLGGAMASRVSGTFCLRTKESRTADLEEKCGFCSVPAAATDALRQWAWCLWLESGVGRKEPQVWNWAKLLAMQEPPLDLF